MPNWSFVTCDLCLQKLPVAGRLKDGTPVYDAGDPRAALPPICIIGAKKQGGPPPITMATAEEYRAYFHNDPPPDWFQPVLTVIPIADGPEPLWPPPYPEQIEPGAGLFEEAIDRSDWSKP